MFRYLCVWKNLNNHTYSFKILKHNYLNYYVGYINEFNHELIIFSDISNYLYHYNFDYKRVIKRKLISFLEK